MSRWFSRVLACLSALGVWGCDPEPSTSGAGGVVSDSAGVRVVDLPRSPAAPSRSLQVDAAWLQNLELEAGRLGDVEPLPGGGAVVLDEMSGSISILAPEGELLLEFGQLGEGPGEFSSRGGINRVVVSDSSLLVPDIQLQRITEFSMDGEVLALHPIPELDPTQGPVYGVDWRSHVDRGIAFRTLTPAGDLLVRAGDQRVDTLHIFDVPAALPNQLLPPTPVWDLDPEGRVVVGRSDRGRIELRAPGAESPVWVVRWDDAAREVSPQERSHLEDLVVSAAEAQGAGSLPAEQRDQLLSSVAFPRSAPLVASVLADPRGRIWIQKAAPIMEMKMEALRVGSATGFGGDEWKVFQSDGLLEEVITLPPGFSPRGFVDYCMYGILENDLGVQRPARVCVD